MKNFPLYVIANDEAWTAGDKARDIFLKSRLSVEKLSQIWFVNTSMRGETCLLNSCPQESSRHSKPWCIRCERFRYWNAPNPSVHDQPLIHIANDTTSGIL